MGHRTTKSKIKVENNKTNNYTEFFYKAFRNILIINIPLVIISALILGFCIPHSSAEVSGSTDNVSLTLSTSCTVNATVTIAHETSLHGGQKDDNVGNTKLSAFCNDNNGYSIYAVGSSGDTDGNTDLINTVNESYNIHTGVYDDSAQTNPSSWAMKLTAGTGTGIDPTTGGSVPTTPPTIINGFDNYSTIPNVYTQVAKRTSGTSMTTDTSVSGSYLNTTYQIYANSAQPAGTYNGKVKYVIVHPNNNNDYLGFNEVFALSGKSPAMTDGNKVYYAMQDMTTSICNQVGLYGEASQTQLVDIRDNNTYWVAKLEDGHCWMTQNLDFDIGANTTLNSNTTDLNVAYDPSTGQYAEYNDGYTKDNGIIYYTPASTATTIDFTGTTVSGWQTSNTAPYTANKTDSVETGHSSLGNYYNWSAAIASNNSSTLTQNTLSDISKNPKNSICPEGWRLPTVSNQSGSTPGSTNEFARLNYLYNNNSKTSGIQLKLSPTYFILSGYINNSLTAYGIDGYYWSNTPIDVSNAYSLGVRDNGVWTEGSYPGKSFGWSTRCIAR